VLGVRHSAFGIRHYGFVPRPSIFFLSASTIALASFISVGT
jgi:hypothetical protein